MPVYADVLIIVNAFVDYLMLLCTMKIMRANTKTFRLLLSAITGGVFSLEIFLPQLPLAALFLTRTIMCTLMILIAFGFLNYGTFLKNFFTFFTVNLLFGGFMLAVYYFINPYTMLYKNSTVYFDIDFKVLCISAVVSYGVITVISKFTERRAPKNSIYSVTVNYNQESVSGRGFTDTGNGLREVFSDTPVIVASYGAVKNILPPSLKAYINESENKTLSPDIRIIPTSTVNGEGFLPSFKADSIIIKGANGEYNRSGIYVAVTKQNLFGGEFEFLLNNELTEERKNEKTDFKAESPVKANNRQ